jgi:hypothetical protein
MLYHLVTSSALNRVCVGGEGVVCVCFFETGSYYISQTGLRLGIILSQPSKCWDYRYSIYYHTWHEYYVFNHCVILPVRDFNDKTLEEVRIFHCLILTFIINKLDIRNTNT